MTPGPGAYEPKGQMGKGPAFSIKVPASVRASRAHAGVLWDVPISHC